MIRSLRATTIRGWNRKGRSSSERAVEFINAWKDRTDYLEDPAVLRLALDQYESWKRRYGSDGDEGYYFWLRTQQDQNDPKLKARFNKIEEFSKKIENDIQFFYLRIARIKPEAQRLFLRGRRSGEIPALPRAHLCRSPLSPERARGKDPEPQVGDIVLELDENDLRVPFPGRARRVGEDGLKKVRSFSEIVGMMNSKVKQARDSAAAAFNDILQKNVEVAEAELNSVLAEQEDR